ncbi:RmlC-like cupin domain-containing protein [Synechococcus sp. Minos11]|uniref:hypothetical protein n=1 Tax=Synechococcus sp. Minos11 TaxID=221341 RepID=UPI001646BE24|nr:hypothetical protein [Synechococcus sp. Minos11]QNJ07695.1 RmlC-like cupin domain-containing protein [Synechococcus sp. Minos11]
MIEHITYGGDLLAIIIRSSFSEPGIHFVTPLTFSQQVGYMNHPKDHTIPPHTHNDVPRDIKLTQEVLLIKSGKLRVDFYAQDHTYYLSKLLFTGDVILLSSGGHGFTMLEDTQLIEVKQGPYVGIADKNRFESVPSSRIVLE